MRFVLTTQEEIRAERDSLASKLAEAEREKQDAVAKAQIVERAIVYHQGSRIGQQFDANCKELGIAITQNE